MVSVEFYPGGCSNLKKYTILTYARTSIKNQYIIFDGDQYMEKVPNFDLILEKDKLFLSTESAFNKLWEYEVQRWTGGWMPIQKKDV